jgi:hypothetical protein
MNEIQILWLKIIALEKEVEHIRRLLEQIVEEEDEEMGESTPMAE